MGQTPIQSFFNGPFYCGDLASVSSAATNISSYQSPKCWKGKNENTNRGIPADPIQT
uniref:Uncharacterized protein n=1 Tax=Anguilla anguilla TaxID=7936 RepID=A0A0E9R6A3_ANGAN